MFVGHYAVGFALKRRFREIPLWLLFVSVQIVDMLTFSFVLLGIERIKYTPSENPFLRTIIEYVPYSHSLLANVLLAAIVILTFWKLKGRTWGIVLSVSVLSHWFLDAMVHTSAIPVIHDSLKVGLGLWRFPTLAFIAEWGALLFTGWVLLKDVREKKRLVILIGLLSMGFAAMFLAPDAEATPAAASVTSLTLYGVFTSLAYWCDRKIDP